MTKLLTALLVALAFCSGVARAEEAPAETKTAIFAGGCFWCIQPAFDKTPGVIKTDRRLLRRNRTESDL